MDPRIHGVQRESARRGFSIHQKVVLEIDFSGTLWGYTEITIVPASSELKTLHLHSRQCAIHNVTVNAYPTEFTHNDPLTNIHLSSEDPKDCHRHPDLKRKVYSAYQEGDEGELSILIPKEVPLKTSGLSSSNPYSIGTPEPYTPGASGGQEFVPIIVRIDYSLRDPVDGFQFVIPNDSYPYRIPHAYTTPSSPDSARCWVPCVDNLWEKSTWEFQFIVPRFLEERSSLLEDLNDGGEATPTIVVCSGDLVEQIAHPYNSNKTIFLFTQAVSTSVQHIAFAAGPFHMHTIPVNALADDPSASHTLMHAFCLPGYETMLSTSVSFLRSAMNFFTSEFGSYPFSTYKLVAVEEMPTQRFDNASMTLITVDVLHNEDAIEQAMEARHVLSHALACQWVGINIVPKAWSDLWLVNGLGLYITGLFLRKLFGNNEYRYRLKKDMQRVLERDNGMMPPICQPQLLDPPDSAVLAFVNLKAPLVLHILDRRLVKSGTALGLSRVLPKMFLSAISGEMQHNAISTHAFLRTCRKVSGVDPRSFAEQWIYGSGCPAFGFSASFNRKKMAVEITMRQEAPAYKAMEDDPISKLLLKPVPFFEGTMTVRIHEADGTPYEHVLDIRSSFKRFEVPFNTKYKRVRRNTKRYLARQAAAQAAAEGDAEAAEAMGLVDMGFGLDIWENEQERDHWKVADWTEEEEAAMSGATYEWIRIDADFEWIANIGFDQPDFMWVSQLQRDRDVVAQLEAIHALLKEPNAIVSSTLTKTVLVTNYYYRVRCEAAMALIHCATRRIDFLGLFHLFKLFLKYCYEPEDPDQDLFTHSFVPKPNNFSDFAEYFVRKTLINAISRVRFENGKTPAVVRQFLIEQLRYNDNTSNPYSDAPYICTVISALSCAIMCTSPPERGELVTTEVRSNFNEEDAELLKQAMTEIDRYRSMDRLIQTPHNVVTIATLEFLMMLTVASIIPSSPQLFFPLTREGNFTQVRIAAFDGLFLTKWYAPPIMKYVLAVMVHDPSRIVRRHVARSACQSLALLVSMGEMKGSMKENESVLVEVDGTNPEKNVDAKKTEVDAMIKALRKDREVGKNEILREFLMPVALSPDIDHEVRWCLLKLADLVVRGLEESPPTVKLHIPTPVVEPPPPTPKIAIKPPRPVISQPSPLTPKAQIPMPRIKLTATPATPIAEQAPQPPHKPTPAGKPAKPGKPIRPVKPDRGPVVLKAQGAGMSPDDLRVCRVTLKKLRAHKHAEFFQQPVDPVRDHAPGYFDLIREPMDLSTMAAKLETGKYKNKSAFEADFRLMVRNARTYNLAESLVYNKSNLLESYFDTLWAKLSKTMNATAEARTTAAKAAAEQTPKITLSKRNPYPAGESEATPTRQAPKAPTKPAPTPRAATPVSRPVIKLKVGGAQPRAGASSPAPTPAEKPKQRPRKPARVPTPEVPPPPYVDDGSHDILQEVLAMEREKEQRRRPSPRPDDRASSSSSTSKRKLQHADDDIFDTPGPSKREKRLAEVASSAESRPATPTIKFKKPKDTKGPEHVNPPASEPIPKPSAKGKEKEKESPAPPPAPPATQVSSRPKHSVVAQATPVNEKKCQQVLKAVLASEHAVIFSRPVDPILDGCPTYLDEIAQPMDFGTMRTKLSQGKYQTMEDFKNDAQLVFNNCRQFNPPTTYPANCADIVEKKFREEWSKAMEKKLSWNEKRGLQSLMTNFVKEDISFVFREPVDPILLNIPTYFEVIPPKDARDLRTIRSKLDNDKYDSVEAFEADIKLMIDNAITFNGPDSEVGAIATMVRKRLKELIGTWKNARKRKEGEEKPAAAHPAKRVKLA